MSGQVAYFLRFVGGMSVLYAVAFVIGLRMRAFLSTRGIPSLLTKGGGAGGSLAAATFGAVTPFCSCTTVPVFAGMLESEVSLGTAMSFLIASPTLNPPALVLLAVVFGWRASALYVSAVFLVALAGGLLLGRRALQGYVYEILLLDDASERPSWREMAVAYLRFLRSFAVVILVAGLVATLLRTWVPSPATLRALGSGHLLGVPLMVLLGVVVYADILLLVPIAHALVALGLPTGSVMAFTMAASGLGIPTLLLLSKLVHRRFIGMYVVVVTLLLIGVGYTLNLLT